MSIIVFGTTRWRHVHSSLCPIMKLLPKELVIGYGKETKSLILAPLAIAYVWHLAFVVNVSSPPDMC